MTHLPLKWKNQWMKMPHLSRGRIFDATTWRWRYYMNMTRLSHLSLKWRLSMKWDDTSFLEKISSKISYIMELRVIHPSLKWDDTSFLEILFSKVSLRAIVPVHDNIQSWAKCCARTRLPRIQSVPVKIRLEIFIAMQNEIQIGTKKLLF